MTDVVRAPKPFLKWLGGKRQLLPQLLNHVPEHFDRYIEPFVGGGALFFALAARMVNQQPPKNSQTEGWESPMLRQGATVLGDTNEHLIDTYVAIQDDVEEVIRVLQGHKYDPAFFQKMRETDPEDLPLHARAAWFIYLNRTCYNGLWRVNLKGRFNAPFGKYVNPKICDSDNLRACEAVLRNALMMATDFSALLNGARKGDFIYCDPPYYPLSATSNFVAFTKRGFSADDHVRLRDLLLRAKRRGAKVLLSNSSAPLIYDLYRDGFQIEEVQGRRAVNSKADRRGSVKELLIW